MINTKGNILFMMFIILEINIKSDFLQIKLSLEFTF